MKAVDLIVNSYLPESLRSDSHDYSSSGIKKLLKSVSDVSPDDYGKIIDELKDLGRNAAYTQGATITLSDLESPFDRSPFFEDIDKQTRYILNTEKDENTRKKKLTSLYMRYSEMLGNMSKEMSNRKGGNLVNIIASGARGNPEQHKAMITTPAIYTDYKGDVIPFFIKNSFADGLSIPEYLAGTYGARSSVILGKSQTARAGALGKDLFKSLVYQSVTSDKDTSGNFIDLDKNDLSAYGRVLAKDTGKYPRGTLIDRKILNDIRGNKSIDKIYVYSPLSTVSEYGLPAEAVGVSYTGKLPTIGYQAGITAAQAHAEPLAQSSLNSKHLGGIAKDGRKNISGLQYIEEFLQSPENFKDAAAVSPIMGSVSSIKDAPQGGKYITIESKNGDKKEDVYVLPNMEIFVKPGDKVENGDIISDGLADIEDVMKYRGLGSARNYMAKRLRKLFQDSGHFSDLKNSEVIARGMLNKVLVTNPDGVGDYMYDDIADYNAIEAKYEPPKSAKYYKTDKNLLDGKYLEKHTLHYTIGTKLTPRMIDRIKKAGIDEVLASDVPPSFEPIMVRARESSMKGNRDWLARQSGSYLKSNLQESAIRGYDTNLMSNLNPLPRMAYGVDFGKNVKETGRF